jgi:hypothetical protein
VIEEARRNLVAKAERIPDFVKLLSRVKTATAQRVDRTLEDSLPLPSKDRPVLAAAIHQNCPAFLDAAAVVRVKTDEVRTGVL